MPYCSLGCYKTHGARCTEEFYESHVKDELDLRAKESKDNGEARRRARELLERMRDAQWGGGGGAGVGAGNGMPGTGDPSQVSMMMNAAAGGGGGMGGVGGMGGTGDVGADEEALWERMEALSVDAELGLEKLTPEERKAFERALAEGELNHLLEVWRPWWLSSEEEHLGHLEDVHRREGQRPLVVDVTQQARKHLPLHASFPHTESESQPKLSPPSPPGRTFYHFANQDAIQLYCICLTATTTTTTTTSASILPSPAPTRSPPPSQQSPTPTRPPSPTPLRAQVMRGTMDGTPVALKLTNALWFEGLSCEDAMAEFAREVNLLLVAHHPNILRL